MIIFPDPINPTAVFCSGCACFLNSIATASTNAVNCAGLTERGRQGREAAGGGEQNRKKSRLLTVFGAISVTDEQRVVVVVFRVVFHRALIKWSCCTVSGKV